MTQWDTMIQSTNSGQAVLDRRVKPGDDVSESGRGEAKKKSRARGGRGSIRKGDIHAGTQSNSTQLVLS
jgi:hypothetical protein